MKSSLLGATRTMTFDTFSLQKLKKINKRHHNNDTELHPLDVPSQANMGQMHKWPLDPKRQRFPMLHMYLSFNGLPTYLIFHGETDSNSTCPREQAALPPNEPTPFSINLSWPRNHCCSCFSYYLF